MESCRFVASSSFQTVPGTSSFFCCFAQVVSWRSLCSCECNCFENLSPTGCRVCLAVMQGTGQVMALKTAMRQVKKKEKRERSKNKRERERWRGRKTKGGGWGRRWWEGAASKRLPV